MNACSIILCHLAFLTVFAAAGMSAETAASHADSLLKARKHFSFAVQYKKSGNYEQAFENYRRSIAYNDTVYQVHYSFADLLMKMNRPLEARREYAASLRLNPNHYKSALMLSKLYYEAAEYDSALTAYETLYRLKPEDPEVLETIAALRDYTGRKKEALDAYGELIARGGDTFDNCLRAASAAVSVGDMEAGDRFIRKALAKRPDDRNALLLAYRISAGRNDLSSATRYLRRLAEIDPDTAVMEKLEKISRARGDTENLMWALKHRHELEPDDVTTIGELAELLFREGEEAQALSYLEKGLKLSPDDGRLHILAGNYYHRKGDLRRALEEYEAALKDEKWKSSAQQFIWRINPPETEAEKIEKEFFMRGKKKEN